MKIKYFLDTMKIQYINAEVYGWPLALMLASGLILLVSVYTPWLNWFWELIVGGL